MTFYLTTVWRFALWSTRSIRRTDESEILPLGVRVAQIQPLRPQGPTRANLQFRRTKKSPGEVVAANDARPGKG